MSDAPVIVLFRDDLRLSDHPALTTAAKTGNPLVCLYVFDEDSKGLRPPGGASRWWLAQSLRALDGSLRDLGQHLVLRRGALADVLPALVKECGAQAVYANRRYDKGGMAADAATGKRLAAQDCGFDTLPGNLLTEPGTLLTAAGTPIKIYAAFWRRLRSDVTVRAPLRRPAKLAAPRRVKSDDLDAWKLEPHTPDWAGGLRDTWTPGETAARDQIKGFIAGALGRYAARRDRLDDDATSRLSPYLRFGEISAAQVWAACHHAAEQRKGISAQTAEKFLSELCWREFAYHVLHEHPDLHTRNLRETFNDFPWRRDAKALRAWQQGRTGYPVVDAGMRQLWQTGWLPNRARMVAGSFLVKHLLIDWRAGEQWFWDTLVDADPGNNPMNWQWVAGTGIDSTPYFRIFNPRTQAEKFDPDGDYVRRFVPELVALPAKEIHRPEPGESDSANGYPPPLVAHDIARKRALDALATLKKTADDAGAGDA